MTTTFRRFYAPWAMVLLMSVMFTFPMAAGAGPARAAATTAPKKGGPELEKAKREKIEKDASIIAKALSFDKKDKKVARDQTKSKELDADGQALLDRLVMDLNAGVIGIAVIEEDGTTTLYGNPKALEQVGDPGITIDPDQAQESVRSKDIRKLNSVSVNWQGVHIYVDPWWTKLLHDLNGWAISTITGLIISTLCGTGIGCIAAGVIASFVWEFVIWRIIKPYLPTSLTIHAPWWGYVTVQTWKAGAWYNGYRFRSWLWT